MKLVQKTIAVILIVGAATALSGLVFAYLAFSLKSASAPPRLSTSPLPTPGTNPTATPIPGAPGNGPTSGSPNSPSGVPTSSPNASPGTNAPRAVNPSNVEETLKSFFAQRTGVTMTSISCPKDLQLKAGSLFSCQATAENQTFPINVQVRSNQGDFGIEVKGLLILSKLQEQIQDTLQQRTGIQITADCGASLRITKAGDTFNCKIRNDQGQSQTVLVTVEDDLGRVRWRVQPQ